jgi:dihydropteroate synthase
VTISFRYKDNLRVFERPLLMGILNITPDSFFENSRFHIDEIIDAAGNMVEAGADILDVGGQSTRPGSDRISASEELDRVMPAVEKLTQFFPDTMLSVDTYFSSVADVALSAGAGILNDVSAGSFDPLIFNIAAKHNAIYVLMHAPEQLNIDNQQVDNQFSIAGVYDFFLNKSLLLKQLGLTDIWLDLGFGFGKSLAQNYQLLKSMSSFSPLGFPILCGLSRKRMIHQLLQISANDSLNGTSVLHTLALLNGASILRVHDVREANEVRKIVQFYQSV